MTKHIGRLRGRHRVSGRAGPVRNHWAAAALLALSIPLAGCGADPADEPPGEAPGAAVVAVQAAWSRETAPGQDAGGAFLTLDNRGAEPDRLLGGSTPVAEDVQVHSVDMAGGVMRMREIAGGLPIPAGGTVTLEPGGYHIMLMGLREPLRQGAEVPLTLTFERAGAVTVALDVRPIGAEGPGEAHDD
jgi:copper(I)-binding protein